MERRKAVIAAATASLTLLAGAAAISLNSGIVGASGNDGAGQISPVDNTATTPPTTIYVDEPASQTTAPSIGQTPSAAASARGDDRYEDDDHEGQDDRPQADGDEYEYEGAEDDD